MSRTYVDTSAAAKLLIVEVETNALLAMLDQSDMELVSTDLLETELGRLAIRLQLTDLNAVAAVLSRIGLATPVRSTYRLAARLSSPNLRSLDAIHLAGAIELNADAILTYDDRMITACQALGLRSLSPR